MGTQPRRMQNGLGQTLLADAVINDILKEAIAAARQGGGQPQLRAVAKLPRNLHGVIADEVIADEATADAAIADEPPLAAVGGRR